MKKPVLVPKKLMKKCLCLTESKKDIQQIYTSICAIIDLPTTQTYDNVIEDMLNVWGGSKCYESICYIIFGYVNMKIQ